MRTRLQRRTGRAAARSRGPRAVAGHTTTRLPGFLRTPAVRRSLARATVAIVGTGSVGSTVLLELCRLGLATVRIVDPGRFKLESSLTHLCATPVGQHKVTALARLCRAFPATAVLPFAADVATVPESLLGADLVVLASDNLECELYVAQLCRRSRTPLLQASVDGETLVAQVRVLTNAAADRPCLGCGYGEAEWKALAAARRFSCAGRSGPEPTETPTRSPSFLCAMAASMCAKEAVLRIARHPRALADAVVEYRGFLDQIVITRLACRPNCALEHGTWQTVCVPGNATDLTVARLVARVGQPPAGLEWLLSADGMTFLPPMCVVCSSRRADGSFACMRERGIGGRFHRTSRLQARCRECGRALVPSVDGRPGVCLSDLTPRQRRSTVRQLGVPREAAIVLRAGDRGVVVTGRSGVRR